MDPADATQLYGLLFTLVLPVSAALIIAGVGRRVWPNGPVASLAVIGGALVAWLGIAGIPNAQNAAHFAIIVGLPVALIALALEKRASPRLVVPLALIGLGLGVYLALKPIAGAWMPDAVTALADGWIIDAILVGSGVWIALAFSVDHLPTPVLLGPIALAMAGGAGVAVLSSSALLGQLLGGVGLVFGVIALAGWHKADLKASYGAIALGITVLGVLLVFGHYTTQLPRGAGTLLLLTPAVALVGRLFERTWVAVLVVGALAAAPVGLAVWLVQGKVAAAEAPDPGGAPEIDYGSLYGG